MTMKSIRVPVSRRVSEYKERVMKPGERAVRDLRQ
jgi:hypothetical protein